MLFSRMTVLVTFVALILSCLGFASSSQVPASVSKSLSQKLKEKGQGKAPSKIKKKPVSGQSAIAKRANQIKNRELLLLGKQQMIKESLGAALKSKKIPELKSSANKRSKSLVSGRTSGGNALSAGEATEYYVSSALQFSQEDYVNNLDVYYWGSFSAPSSADYIYLNFSYLDLENSYDRVYVYDGFGNLCDTLTGYYSSGRNSVACAGNYAEVYITTDSSNDGSNGYTGFYINGYTYGIEAVNTPPVAFAAANTYSNPDGAQFTFYGNESYDPDSGDSIYTYEWDFGDGSTWTNSLDVFHTYALPGTYNVYLTVWDESGLSAEDSFTVQVFAVPEPYNFTISSTTGRSISLQWGIPSDVSGFYLNWVQGFQASIACYPGTNLGYSGSTTITGLTPSTNYTVALCSFNSYGRLSVRSAFYVTTPTITFPPSPQSLSTSNLGAHRFQINWNSGGGNTVDYVVAMAVGTTFPQCSAGAVQTTTQKLFTGLTGNTNHAVTICSRNSDGDFSTRATLLVTTNPVVLPPVPQNLAVRNLFANRFTLDWTNGGGNTAEFLVAIATGTTAPSCSGGTNVALATTRNFTALTGNTNYTVSVCARNSEADSSAAATLTILTPPTPVAPPAVINLQATSIGVSTVTITWESGGGTTDTFRVARSTGTTAPNCSTAGSNVGNVTTHTATGLTGNTTYTFVVCAVNNVSAVGPSISIQPKTINGAAAPNPSGFAVNTKTQTSINYRWVSGGGSTTGYLFSGPSLTTPAANCAGGVPLTSLTYDASGLSPFTTYVARVCAVNALGVASSGVTLSSVTLDNAPSNVTNLAASTKTTNSITLGWDYSGPNVGGNFVVNRATGTTPPASCSSGTNVALNLRSLVVNSLAANQNYAFRVCTKNGNGTLSAGTTLVVNTHAAVAPQPRNLVLTPNSTIQITAAWQTGGTGTVGYFIKWQVGSTAPADCSGGVSVGSSTSFAISPLQPGTLYSVRVCSTNSTGLLSAGITGSVSTISGPPPGPSEEPVNVLVTFPWTTKLKMTWASGGPQTVGYRIKIVTGGAPASDCIGGIDLKNVTQYEAYHLNPGSTYSIRICSYNILNQLSSGIALTATTLAAAGVPSPWQNPGNSLDVNRDGYITGLDALLIVNQLNVGNIGELPDNFTPSSNYLDVNGDGYLTGLDALIVVNYLNTHPFNSN